MFTKGEMEGLGPQGIAREEPKTQPEDQVQISEELSVPQKTKMRMIVWSFRDVFHKELGWAQGTCHTINTLPGVIVQERW